MRGHRLRHVLRRKLALDFLVAAVHFGRPLVEPACKASYALAVGRDRGREARRQFRRAEEPLDGVAERLVDREQHIDLRFRRHLVVERLDRFPRGRQVERLARQQIGARDFLGRLAGAFRYFQDEMAARAVNEVVGQDGRYDLARQLVPRHILRVFLAQRLGK